MGGNLVFIRLFNQWIGLKMYTKCTCKVVRRFIKLKLSDIIVTQI